LDFGDLLMRYTILAFLAFTIALSPVRAQTIWEIPTEYPASAMPGEGVATFAAAVEKRLSGKLVVKPSYNAERGINSAEMPAAVASGKVQAADAFSGALGSTSPVFALSSLPFLATSLADARRLADLGRPLYEEALAAKGLKLLYVTPWPPSGIWSKVAIVNEAGLKALPIRTYDATSSAVFTAAGAHAQSLSFADVMPKLTDGSISAVLSSGDGGAGRRLWTFLPHFAQVNYAVPLSFAFVSKVAYDALPEEQRRAVDESARETEASQWLAINGRLEANYAVMRANGVTITDVPADVAALLRLAAIPALERWAQGAGESGRAVLAAFRR
jgi:TRAP-type transport system periplasmic protein